MIRRCAKQPVFYAYAPCAGGGTHAKLVRANADEHISRDLHRLALDGYLAERIAGCGGRGEPPETVITYTVTALGRDSVGLHRAQVPAKHRSQPLTDAELEAEGIE